jgi:hypothetical protein
MPSEEKVGRVEIPLARGGHTEIQPLKLPIGPKVPQGFPTLTKFFPACSLIARNCRRLGPQIITAIKIATDRSLQNGEFMASISCKPRVSFVLSTLLARLERLICHAL